MNDKKNSKSRIPFCYSPFFEMTIYANGKVGPCCFLDRESMEEIDNVKEKSTEEVWRGDSFNTFRKRVLTKMEPVTCRKCSVSPDEMLDLKNKFEKNYKNLTDTKNYLNIQIDLIKKLIERHRKNISTSEEFKKDFIDLKKKLEEKKEELINYSERSIIEEQSIQNLKKEYKNGSEEFEVLEKDIKNIDDLLRSENDSKS